MIQILDGFIADIAFGSSLVEWQPTHIDATGAFVVTALIPGVIDAQDLERYGYKFTLGHEGREIRLVYGYQRQRENPNPGAAIGRQAMVSMPLLFHPADPPKHKGFTMIRLICPAIDLADVLKWCTGLVTSYQHDVGDLEIDTDIFAKTIQSSR